MSGIVLELPDDLRSDLKTPMGPIYTRADDLLAVTSRPLVTVGDVVTYHVVETGAVPDVALVDERTERSAVEPEVATTIRSVEGFDRTITVQNPPGTLTADLLTRLRAAIESGDRTLLQVDGEEDLATLPAVILTPETGSVVYGQPGEGMVHVSVDATTEEQAAHLLDRMDGDKGRLATALGE